jgi:hypothetical protein
VNKIEKEQLAFGAMVEPQLLVCENSAESPRTVTEEIDRGGTPLFRSVTVAGALLVLMNCPPKLSAVVDNVTPG